MIMGTVKYYHSMIMDGLKSHIRTFLKKNELTELLISKNLSSSRYVIVITIFNELNRMEFFIEYYKNMGFEEFIVVDNRSTDGIYDFLIKNDCISIIRADGDYKKSRYGNDWINNILSKYCVGKWVLYVDADEIFVFPGSSTKKIQNLTSKIEKHNIKTIQCIMIDMYSEDVVANNIYMSGQNPLDVCSYFDKTGYNYNYVPYQDTTWIKGGVRFRMYFKEIDDGPALNKTPLVLWKRHYRFLQSSHRLWPPHLNNSLSKGGNKITGALLHFKFLSDFSDKIKMEMERKQHTEEYNAYNITLSKEGSLRFINETSEKYVNENTLMEFNLIEDSLDGD